MDERRIRQFKIHKVGGFNGLFFPRTQLLLKMIMTDCPEDLDIGIIFFVILVWKKTPKFLNKGTIGNRIISVLRGISRISRNNLRILPGWKRLIMVSRPLKQSVKTCQRRSPTLPRKKRV